jgi:radical SAM superfamily enzyme YgiQ (UPF0313 family)
MTKKLKKIVFIEPNPPEFHVFSGMALPRLGTILLGTKLKEAGYEVKSYVECIEDLDIEDILTADAVGISTLTSTSIRSYEIATLLRDVGMPVFMGGPHVTFLPEEALGYCDYVLRGESDDVIIDFVKALETGEGFEDINGLTYRKDGEIIHNKATAFCKDLDTLPNPDYTIVKGLEGNAHKKFTITPIMTSRGCPYDCSFCSVTSMFGRKYRFRSKERVMEELRTNKANGSKWVFFYDDNFIANKKRTKELLKTMIEEGVTPNWTAQLRVEVAKDPELIDLMVKSGCHTVYIGFESVNPATLEAYNKSQSLEDIQHSINVLHKAGIRIHGMFVLGSDEDTVDTLHDTLKFAKDNKLQTIQFLMLTPLPGTKLYFDLEREDRLMTKDWSQYDAHHVVYKPKQIPYYELLKETINITNKFYSPWPVVERAVHLDWFGTVIKLYGYKQARKWARKDRALVEYMQKVSQAGKQIEIKAKKTAEDLKEKFRQLELAGNLRVNKNNPSA